VNATAAPAGANSGTATGAAVSGTKTAAAVGGSGSGAAGGGSGGGGSGVDPGVSLAGTSAMAGTGMNPVPFTALGLGLIVLGVVGRRRVMKRRVTGRTP